MNVIEVNHLTKDYGHGRGIYDISLNVKKGEVFGFLGPNGAGKSTTIRHLMGFAKPQKGQARILGKDCWSEGAKLREKVGYLPGEVVFPEGLTGNEVIQMIGGLRGDLNEERLAMLLERFEINPNQNIKKMSIGEKRKIAVVTAFMNDPEILLLDEPTSGLDPVMQEVFIDFIKEEKDRGKTVLLSSHIFHEVEELCDQIAIIKEGKIISNMDAEKVRHYNRKSFELTLGSSRDYNKFLLESFEVCEEYPEENRLVITLEDEEDNEFLGRIVRYKVTNFVERQQSMEDYFMEFYRNKKTFHGMLKKEEAV